MNELIRTLSIGLGATLVMDLWTIVRKRLWGVPPPDYALVGRCLAHMALSGRVRYDRISASPAVCPVPRPPGCRASPRTRSSASAFTQPVGLPACSLPRRTKRIPARFAPLLFGALLSLVMVSLVSAFVIAITQGMHAGSGAQWFTSCLTTWPVALPTVTLVAPWVRRIVGYLYPAAEGSALPKLRWTEGPKPGWTVQ